MKYICRGDIPCFHKIQRTATKKKSMDCMGVFVVTKMQRQFALLLPAGAFVMNKTIGQDIGQQE
jgi:hypothetical protein